MDAQHLDRLKEEQLKAIEDTNERIGKLETFADDYKNLQSRLDKFSERISHDVMVPFGKFAFMPGQLIHTNEVMVLLGDDWFCERSTKQAIEIADRRVEAIKVQIDRLQQQKGLLEPRLQFTSELDDLVQNKQDMLEIKEDFDEEKEAQWLVQHRKNVRAHKETLRKQKATPEPPDSGDSRDVEFNSLESEDALWKRLDELELQERRNREMFGDLSTANSETAKSSHSYPTNFPMSSGTISTYAPKSGVRWKDQEEEEEDTSEEEEDEEYDSDDYEGSSEDQDGHIREGKEHRPKTISFRHSSPENDQILAGGGHYTITSPADVYEQFVKPVLQKPKSILKSSSREFEEHQIQPVKEHEEKAPRVIADTREMNVGRPEAFTGTIVEKTSQHAPSQDNTTDLGQSTSHSVDTEQVATAACDAPKRVSRFKAQRSKTSS